ncbi:CPBP family intramembrane glutamic endopeptidase [Aestuariicoccus sp. MJ-SS9]|uniref:CPBP family intramembrane glutamic endopeptidase n=1 Tax=Aestuariicoccus sp. MJ-SS9 TaxID=3079855 RepID=UPI0029150681|nr:CPBP family intramembrane glutamic endopeptidase [Aestuariicoccus sp. MJ-SS9]MDU8910719.1 CPBP family intramembrane glutamic endopeptidase [Aestuariicoccus sp. MJ-SS9]
MSYDKYKPLIAPARAKAQIWRLGAGIALTMLVMFGLGRGVVTLLHMVLGDAAFRAFWAEVQTGMTPAGLLFLLSSMGTVGLATIVTARVMHRRGAGTLFGPRRAFWGQFLRVAFAIAALQAAMAVLPPWPKFDDLQPGLPTGLWLQLLPLTLIALMIQTGSEELFFRGYLQSQLAARFSHPGVWLVLPSALFALGHYVPTIYDENALWVALWAFIFGVTAADLTARSGTLGPAIALHLVNNFMAIAVTALPGDMSGLALYQLPFGAQDAEAMRAVLPLDLATLIVSWLAARLALRA